MPLTAMVLLTMGSGLRAQNLDGGSLSLKWMPGLNLDALAGKASTGKPLADTPAALHSASATSAFSSVGREGAATPLPLLLDAAERAAGNRAAEAGVDAARAQQQQAWSAAWMPRLDASARRLRQKNSTSMTLPDGTSTSASSGPQTNMTLNASLPVWRAADRASAKAQTAVTEQSEWQARGQRANTARDVSLAYIGAAEANEQRRLAEAQQALLQTQLHINDRRMQAGMGTVLDQLETRTRLDQARASVQELVMRATSQRLVMERLAARPVQLPAGFNPATARISPELPSLEEALSMATERNPDIRDARAAVEAARQTNSARDAEFWQPTVDAVATLDKERRGGSLNDQSFAQRTTDRTIGLQLNWALFTGGVQQGRVKESSALLVQAQARLDDAQGLVQASLRDAYQNLFQAQAIIGAQQDVEATATATFEAVRKAFVAGMRTNIDLLNAQQQIYSARQSVVAARVTALSAQINILALLDQLDAGHVAPITAHFDAEAMAAASSSPAMPVATQMQQTTR
jgi:protease secretion system outer membrane protein